MKILKPYVYMDRLHKYVCIPYYLNKLGENASLKKDLLRLHMRGFHKEFLRQDLWSAPEPVTEKSPGFKMLMSSAAAQRKVEIEQYVPMLFNQSFVMACTIFEIFLCDTMKTILPVAAKSSEILESFEHVGIAKDKKNKIKMMQDHLGWNLDDVFLFVHHKQTVQTKYAQARTILKNIYSRRNDIVHRDVAAIRTQKELEQAANFLVDLMLSFAWDAKKKFGVDNDFDIHMLRAASLTRRS